jgi:hypothetical protein
LGCKTGLFKASFVVITIAITDNLQISPLSGLNMDNVRLPVIYWKPFGKKIMRGFELAKNIEK